MHPPKLISLKDIADKAGVSKTLVSYILNDRIPGRINKETADLVRKVAQELNYQPNQIARSLRTKKTNTIGLILSDISNPFSATIARIIEDQAKKSGYSVLFGSADENPEKSMDLINVLLNRQVDGFIIAPAENSQEQLDYLTEKQVPYVLVDRYFPEINTDLVATDNYNISRAAVEHLVDNGYQKIGMINYQTTLFHLNERTRGYTEALCNLGSANTTSGRLKLIDQSATTIEEQVIKSIDALMAVDRQSCDAIFFASVTLTIFGLKYINKLGLKVPEQLGVVGFDETDAYDLFTTPVTYVRQPMHDLGVQAVTLLLEKMANRKKNTEQSILRSQLIIKESSGKKTAGCPGDRMR